MRCRSVFITTTGRRYFTEWAEMHGATPDDVANGLVRELRETFADGGLIKVRSQMDGAQMVNATLVEAVEIETRAP